MVVEQGNSSIWGLEWATSQVMTASCTTKSDTRTMTCLNPWTPLSIESTIPSAEIKRTLLLFSFNTTRKRSPGVLKVVRSEGSSSFLSVTNDARVAFQSTSSLQIKCHLRTRVHRANKSFNSGKVRYSFQALVCCCNRLGHGVVGDIVHVVSVRLAALVAPDGHMVLQVCGNLSTNHCPILLLVLVVANIHRETKNRWEVVHACYLHIQYSICINTFMWRWEGHRNNGKWETLQGCGKLMVEWVWQCLERWRSMRRCTTSLEGRVGDQIWAGIRIDYNLTRLLPFELMSNLGRKRKKCLGWAHLAQSRVGLCSAL